MPVEDFLALFEDPEAVAGIFVWDTSTTNWSAWRRGLHASLQAVTTIEQSLPLLLLLDIVTPYESEVAAHDAGVWPLAVGFSALSFLGADGSDPVAALERVAASDNVEVVFRFNNENQSWDAFRSGLPAALNTLRELGRWDLLLVASSAPTSWAYEAFEPE